MAVKLGYVWLDVKQRRTVENVYVTDVQEAVFDPVEMDDGKADGVGPRGGAGGEETAGFCIQEWNDVQVVAAAAVEMVEQDDVGESVKILQSGMICLKQFDCALNAGGSGGLNRHTFKLVEWCVDDSNGI